MRRTRLGYVSVALLAGCSGGSDSSSVPLLAQPTQPATADAIPACARPVEGTDAASPAAVVGGTITGRSDPSFLLVVLGEQRLLFYGPDLPAVPRISGFVSAGNPGGWCSSNDLTTYNGRDRNLAANSESKVYLYTSVTTSPAGITGSLRYPSATSALTGGSLDGAAYDGTARPALSDAKGSWVMTGLDGASADLSIDEVGRITGSDRGCLFSGTVTASNDEGTNVLRVRLRVSMCDWPRLDQPYEGFAVVMPMKTGGARLLLWAQTDNGIDWDYVAGIGSRR